MKFNLSKWIYIFAIVFPVFTKAYVSIDVGKAYIRESQMAIQPLVLSGPSSKPALEAGATIFSIIKDNLSSSSYFKLIEQEAFLEKPGEKKLEPYPEDPDGFIWKNWQLLNADYLVLSGYSFEENKIQLHLYLYHVPLKRKIFQKKYIADMKLVEKLSHKMCNDIISALTKKPGIFLTKIVAVRTMTGSKKELFIMNWNGKNKKQISFHNSTVLSPSWSKDGRHIAYTSFLYRKSTKRRNASLILYDRSTKTRRILSKKEGAHLGSDFIPGGKHILLSLFLGRGYMDIAKMSLKDGSIKAITFGPNRSINVEPVAHPKGKNILFSSDRGGKIMIYSMDMNGKNIRPVTWHGSYNSTPDYSPDGKEVVFSSFSSGRFDIFIMNPDGSNLRRLTSFQKPNGKWANNESPSFAPDGRHIVFTSNRTGRNQLYIMNLLNFRTTRITTDMHNYKSPKWSPLLN
ncbi:MAG: translocation protein TolB [Oligoflexia bacterium]|nr:translocation protein TolB [Bdellovibrionales bacterium]MYE07597.1 translocation protein TolB [Oligoflexia bacterium]